VETMPMHRPLEVYRDIALATLPWYKAERDRRIRPLLDHQRHLVDSLGPLPLARLQELLADQARASEQAAG
jgi:hypothetical protein